MDISQSELKRIMGVLGKGGPSPFGKRKDKIRGGGPTAVVTFAGEEGRWIGRVDTEMFSSRGSNSFGVYIGVSPYRMIFYRASSVFSDLCRSYWFEVDMGGRTWQKGTIRKREYNGIGVARPRFKKGMLSQKIIMALRSTRTDGKEETIFEHELSGLEWYNPATEKYEGGKGQSLYDQLMEACDNRIPISVSDLWLMDSDPHRAMVTAPSQVAEAGAVRAEVPVPVKVAAAPATEEKTEVCPQCGDRLKAGIQFCGKCGHGLAGETMEAETPQVEAVAQETTVEKCPRCGQPFKPGIQFCGKCGHRLEAETLGTEKPGGESAEKVVEEERTAQGEAAREAALGKCPDCGKPSEAGWQACPYCGARLPSACPECGKATEPEWVACPYCSASLEDG